MRSLTIFLLGDGEHGAAVLELADSWTRSGILDEALWLTPSGVVSPASGPPDATAVHMGRHGLSQVNLFEHIGKFRLELVRVVVGHLLPDDETPSDTDLNTVGNQIALAIRAALPRGHGGAAERSTRLHRAVVVVPASGVTGKDPAVLQPGWEVNAIISPEDRPDLDRSSIYVRHPGNFHGHAAAALAAVGGVLRGVPAGALDDITSDSTSMETDAVVARIMIRSVIGEDVLNRIARQVFDPESLAPDGPASVLSWARPASQPDLVVNQAAHHVLAQPEWKDAPPPETPSPSVEKQSFWSALLTAAKFNVKTTGAVFSWELSRRRAELEQRATHAIVGGEGGALVTLGPRPVEELAGAANLLIARQRDQLERQLQFESTRAHAIPPSTWSKLRDLTLGLVDGGDLGDFPAPRQLGKRELLSPSTAVVVPGSGWEGLDGQVVLADDPLAMRSYGTDLKVALDESHGQLAELTKELEDAERRAAEERAAAEETAPTDKETEDTRGAAGTHSGAAPGKKSEAARRSRSGTAIKVPEDPAVVRTREKLTRAKREHAALVAHRAAYDAWSTPIMKTLLWRVADDVGQRWLRSNAEREALEAGMSDDEAPPAEGLKAAQKRLMLVWRIFAALWVVAIGYITFLWKQEQQELSDALLSAGGVTAAVTIVLAAANHRFYKAVRHYEWMVKLVLARLRGAADRYLHFGQEAARLHLMYEALRDWTRILGEVTHRPWQPPEEGFEDLPEHVVAALPAAMGVGRQTEERNDVPQSSLVSAYRTLYTQGWCSKAFERAYEYFEAQSPTAPREGHRDVDLDALDSPISPRRRLRDYWVNGEARSRLAEGALQVLRDAVNDDSLPLPTRVVSRLGRHGDGQEVPEASFLEAMATENTALAVDTFSAPGQIARKHYTAQSIAWLPDTPGSNFENESVEIRAAAGHNTLRVDVSRRVSPSELAVFSNRPGTETSEAPSDDPAVPGPIFH